MKWLIKFVLLIVISHQVHSQTPEVDLAAIAEELIQTQQEGVSYGDLYESLAIRFSNKLNVNSASDQDLQSLYILSNNQIHQLKNYLKTHGNLLSIHELQAVPSFDLTTIRKLLPFVTLGNQLGDSRSLKERVKNSDNNFLLLRYSSRLEKQLGYSQAVSDTTFVTNEDGILSDTLVNLSSRYSGSPSKIYGRLKISNPKDFSFGITFEKDAGEPIEFSKKNKGFDFYSYHLLLENMLGFKRIIVGDYQIQAGQSLVLSGGFSPGKGAQTIQSTRRNTLGIRPYTSALESGFFRGLAFTKSVRKIDLTLFFSRLRQDGNIQTEDIEEDQLRDFINSIQRSGLHRTINEITSKNAVLETAYGAHLSYQFSRSLQLGATGLQNHFNLPIEQKLNNYNQFEFRGTNNYTFSSYLNYNWNNFSIFSEAAISKSGGKGIVLGIIGSLHQKLDVSILNRSYDRDFHGSYGNSFSEGSRNINEKGTYIGLQITPNRKQTLNGYIDLFRFPWLRYRVDAPSAGHEYLIRYTYQPKKKIQFITQYKRQIKERSFDFGNTSSLIEQVKENYLVGIRFEQNDISTQTRIQGSTVKDLSFSKGIALIQDLNFKIGPIRCYSRYAIFDTDNFDNAQFAYERDVLYSFSIPSYSGRGTRNYFMIRYDISSSLSTWIRYASSIFPGKEELGSSLNKSEGDKNSEIKCMIRWKI